MHHPILIIFFIINFMFLKLQYHQHILMLWYLFVSGLQRGYSEDAVEADELIMNGPSPDSPPSPSKLKHKPSRPPRRGSLSRNATFDNLGNAQMNGTLEPGKWTMYTIILLRHQVNMIENATDFINMLLYIPYIHEYSVPSNNLHTLILGEEVLKNNKNCFN